MIPALDELRERYLRAQLAGDRREAARVLEEGLRMGAEVPELQCVVRAAQEEIGRLWQLNLVTIAQEHMATAISHFVLSALVARAERKAAIGKRVLIACVEGEQHDLPARIVADMLELEGFEMRFLGADVPHDSLAEMVREERPHLVGLSVSTSLATNALRDAVSRVRVVTGVPICAGGQTLLWAPSLASELAVHTASASPDGIVAMARRLTGLR